MNRTALLNGALAVAAALTAAVGVVLVTVAGTPDPKAVGMALLAAGYFAASSSPALRRHGAYGLLSAAYAVALVGLWGLTVVETGVSTLPALVGVLAVAWLVVELFERRGRRRLVD